jgi:hypothetical protein
MARRTWSADGEDDPLVMEKPSVAFASRTAWLVTARGCRNPPDALSPSADDVVAC